MSKEKKPLSQQVKMTIVAAIVGLCLTLLSLIFLIWDMWDWTIGVALGSCLEILFVYTMYISSDAVVREQNPLKFYLFYVLRLLVLLAVVIVTCVLTYVLEIKAINIFGVLIGFTPMQFVVVISMVVMERKEEKQLAAEIKEEQTKVTEIDQEKKDEDEHVS